MFKHFTTLQWKSFFRSASLGKSLAIKILMGFFALYMLSTMLMAGIGLFFGLQKAFPGTDPLTMVSNYLIYWVLAELFFRYFMQKLPVMDIKPLLTIPIKKRAITHYVLGRSGVSIYNLFDLVFFTPFTVVLLFQGYPVLHVIGWFVAMIAVVLSINYINFLINKSNTALLALLILLGGSYGLDYFDIYPVHELAGRLFYTLYQQPVFAIIPILLTIALYSINYRFLRNRIFLDASLRQKTKEAVTSDLSWTRKFGDIAPFLQLDLKLIWRNKRTKVQVFVSLAMIFYGLIFYSIEDFGLNSVIMVVVGILMTGIFLMNFGQFIPAWDSAYFSMIMSQNIPLRKYLEAKAGLIALSVVVMFLLSIPYVYFGWQALAINFSTALYNLGINIPVILFFGSMNKKRIDLTKSPVGNIQGTGAAQFLVGIPLFGAPMLIYGILTLLFSFEVAIASLAILGIVGFAYRKPILDTITLSYRKKKYGMIAGFQEKNG
ncbi:hypothetical protein FK220_007165 [Flavobacteriaceae bacterium TP-CH-4]|uniref:Uncharacterized protein n=1 Tax=Pelagihabitans pacificus TaxID=2696054 RepID=A0A967AU91_9FLAO|nr:DUF5687 family protein [Pelagihabitans pacificus]NHF59113.1 hypothetical protein [Pelagihabitans pacificus]